MNRLAVFLVSFSILALPALSQTYPDHTSLYVNDFADLIDPETESRIEDALQQVKADRGVEMTVVTINSRFDYGDSPAIEPFATGLFNYWGVGDANRNDGIMILVARQDRDIRIEPGKGYPARFDDRVKRVKRVKRVIDHHFIPYFRKDEYAAGIEAGVLETIKRTELVFGEDGTPTFSSRAKLIGKDFADHATSGGILTWFLGLVGLGGGAFGFRRYRRYRRRRCELCNRKMVLLSEEADDKYLSQGQQVEEAVKSKDYDVWYCEVDDHTQIIGHKSFFKTHAACQRCGFETVSTKRRTLVSATTTSTGKAEVDYTCHHCGDAFTEHVTIPKVTRSSSSSSSGSSFGGGSSSGGGASGSW